MSFKYKYRSKVKIVAVLFIICIIFGQTSCYINTDTSKVYATSIERQYLPSGKLDVFQYPIQTPVSGILTDEEGLPYQMLNDRTIIRNPSNIASLLFLHDRIRNDMGAAITATDEISTSEQYTLTSKQIAALNYCKSNLKHIKYNSIDADLLIYNFEYIYNEHIVKPPFGSAIAQYAWLRALSLLYDNTKDEKYFEMLIRALNAFRVPVEYGGLLYEFDDGDIWFEEMPVPNPTHILNGHLAATSEIYKTAQKYGLEEFAELAVKGIRSAEKRLDIFDLDEWSRYDMAWKLYENMFKVEFEADVKGIDESQALAISNIETYRKKEGKRLSFNTADADAFQGALRLAGMGWSNVDNINGELGRWLIPPKYNYADYQNKFWENDIQTLMFLEFPDSSLPYEKEGDFGLKFRYFAKYPGELTISLRDNSHGEDYKYNKSISFTLKNTGKWEDISFDIDRKFFSGYVGPRYHAVHINMLNSVDNLINSNKFEDKSIKFYNNYKDYSDHDPINIRGIDTLWGNTQDLNINKDIEIKDMSGTFETLEQYNIKKLIDGKIESNTATQYNSDEAMLSIKLKKSAELDSLKIIPYSKDIYFDSYKISLYNKGKLSYEEDTKTAKKALDSTGVIFYRFDKPVVGDEVRISLRGYKGQERFVLNEITLYGSYDRAIGKQILNTILDGTEDELSKVIKIGSYVTDYFMTGFPKSGDFESMLSQRLAGCGERSQIMRYLLAEVGVKSRFINLYNMPQTGDGHSLIEAFVANKWVYYDPSYAYFVAVPRAEVPRNIEDLYRLKEKDFILASLEDLSEYPDWIEKYAMHYDFVPWSAAEREKTFAVHNLANFSLGQYTSPNTVAVADPKGPIGKEYITKFKIPVGSEGVSYGTVDNYFSDLNKIGIPSGISYIGLSSWNVKWEFVFENEKIKQKKWKIEIYPQLVSGNDFLLTLKPNNCLINGKKELEVKPAELNGKPIILEIERENENDFSVEVYHNEKGYMNVDAIRVQPTNE